MRRAGVRRERLRFFLATGPSLVNNGRHGIGTYMIQWTDKPKRKCPTDQPDERGRVALLGHRLIPLTTDQQRVVERNQGLIWMYIKKYPRQWAKAYYARFGQNEWESLAQAVLCAAASKHDPAKGKFTTIYSWMVRQTAFHEMNRSMRTREMQSLLTEDENGNMAPTIDTIGPTVEDVDPGLAELPALLRRLSPREQQAISGRFWRDQTLKEVGLELGVTDEYVRQIQNAALAKLRAAYS